ncbi:hypothetical protein GCM10010421_51400 [Streptomyces glaucus]|uniref:Secreted protein n=1 Tax=Streptomyces glaucus TaxID=284029 RepID=A0ABN3K869_9ACTN
MWHGPRFPDAVPLRDPAAPCQLPPPHPPPPPPQEDPPPQEEDPPPQEEEEDPPPQEWPPDEDPAHQLSPPLPRLRLPDGRRAPRPDATGLLRAPLRPAATAATTTATTTTRMMPMTMASPSFRSPEAAPRGRLARRVTGRCPSPARGKAELRNSRGFSHEWGP